MSDNALLLVAVGLGVALTALFSGLGLWLGYHLGKSAAPPPNPALALQIERLFSELAFCQKLSGHAVMHAQQLSEWAVQSAIMPSNMTATLHQMVATTQSLSHRLQKAGARTTVEAKPAKASLGRSSPAKVSHADLSAKELGHFTETEPRRVEADGESDRRRYTYDCLQRVLAWEDPNGALPSTADTVVVRCHDISSQGISFFWPDDPHFKHLLISLGNDEDMMFMAAEIVHSKPVYMHGEWQYVVSCRFTKRMREFTEQWKQ